MLLYIYIYIYIYIYKSGKLYHHVAVIKRIQCTRLARCHCARLLVSEKHKGGRNLTTKWLLWTTSNHHVLGSLISLGLNFSHVCSIEVSSTLKSHDRIWKVTCPEYENPINSNSLQVTLIKTMLTVKETSEAKSVTLICRNSH